MHLPVLVVALLIMLACSLYPPLLADASGRAGHGFALALFCAMSAGFVRGVGFVPRRAVWRWLFSEWACLAALGVAVCLKYFH